MRRGTTPYITVETNLNLNDYTVDFVIENGDTKLHFEGDRVNVQQADDGSIIRIKLTEAETRSLVAGTQARVEYRAVKDGDIQESEILTVQIDDTLFDNPINA